MERCELFDDLPKETLLKIIDTYAKAWQAMDGAYFLSLEKKYGMDVAIEMDKDAWKIFSPIEAKRIMREFGIEENGGLKALEKRTQPPQTNPQRKRRTNAMAHHPYSTRHEPHWAE